MKYWKEKESNPVESMQYWQGTTITKLEENEIFVMGTNPSGIHGAGAAKAGLKFGAKMTVGRGLMGSTYGLITKNLEGKAGFVEKATGILYDKEGYCSVSPEQIRANIDELYEIAKKPEHQNKKFLISYQYESWPNGTPKKSLNGYTSQEMLEMFVKDKEVPSNIVFHDSYKPHLEKLYKNQNRQTSGEITVFENDKTIDIKEEDIIWTIDSDERNPEGIHGAGGAKVALKFGASFGNGRGLMGKSYGLVTKNLNAGFTEKSTGITYHKDGYCSVSEEQIRTNINELYDCAKQNPDKNFLITFQYETWPNGTPKKSLNGYTSEEMFQMFVRTDIPSNIVFHDSYKDRLEAILKSNQNTSNSNKDYILFVNYPTQDILSDSNFWTDLINDLSNVKEHTQNAGIAKHIRINFPESYEADKKTIYGDKNKLGTFSEARVNINGHNLTIINAYTQYRYGRDKDHFEYDKFPKLLQSIKAKYGDKRIGLPLIGCGLAGGDEARILKMIKENFEGVDYKLVEIDPNRKLKLDNYENSNQQINNYNKSQPAIIAFTKVSLPYGWMGNMAPYPINYNEVEYKTTEALFQSLRFEKYPDIQKEIRNQKSPMAAKMVAKEHKDLLINDGFEVLGTKDVENMKLCIQLKLEQHPELAKQLIETGDRLIIEDCTSRPQGSGLFWGAAYQNNQWVGKNVLGEVLMEARSKLQNNLSEKIEIFQAKEQTKEYTFFFHLTSPFSNFHPAKFEYKDLTFISNEQFMMYSKAKNFGDEVSAQKIIDINNEPLAKDFIDGKITREQIVKDKELSAQWQNMMMKAKKFGRGVQNYDEERWNQRRSKIVLFGARLKFTQNQDLKQILLDTGDTTMVEAAPRDPLSTMEPILQKLKEEFLAEIKEKNKFKP